VRGGRLCADSRPVRSLLAGTLQLHRPQGSLSGVHAAGANGRIIDQTIWTYYFDPGVATITTEGREHIKSLLQRRPAPDTTIYLATAQEFRDLTYDPAAPEKFVEKRSELNTQRAQELQKYLLAQTAGRNLCFQIVVHDPAEVGHELRTIPVNNAVLSWYGSFTGSLLGGGGGGAGAGAGTGTGNGGGGGGGVVINNVGGGAAGGAGGR